jgi:hypothetical protein
MGEARKDLQRRRNGDKRRSANHVESSATSRESLVQTYIDALPLARVAIVAIPGRGCRVAVGGEIGPGEKIAHQFFFKPLHIELVLGAAGLGDGPIRQPAVIVAEQIEQAAAKLGARWQTADGLRKVAAEQVDEIVERVKTAGLSGKLKRWNAAYRQYRLEAVAKAEKAIPYAAFLEQVVTMPTVKQLAMTGRTV